MGCLRTSVYKRLHHVLAGHAIERVGQVHLEDRPVVLLRVAEVELTDQGCGGLTNELTGSAGAQATLYWLHVDRCPTHLALCHADLAYQAAEDLTHGNRTNVHGSLVVFWHLGFGFAEGDQVGRAQVGRGCLGEVPI